MAKPAIGKEFRREWAQEAARNHIRMLRNDGATWEDLAELLGLSTVFLGRVVRSANPDRVSERLWNALIEKAGFDPYAEQSAITNTETTSQTIPNEEVPVSRKELEDLRLQVQTVTRLVHLLLDMQGAKP